MKHSPFRGSFGFHRFCFFGAAVSLPAQTVFRKKFSDGREPLNSKSAAAKKPLPPVLPFLLIMLLSVFWGCHEKTEEITFITGGSVDEWVFSYAHDACKPVSKRVPFQTSRKLTELSAVVETDKISCFFYLPDASYTISYYDIVDAKNKLREKILINSDCGVSGLGIFAFSEERSLKIDIISTEKNAGNRMVQPREESDDKKTSIFLWAKGTACINGRDLDYFYTDFCYTIQDNVKFSFIAPQKDEDIRLELRGNEVNGLLVISRR